MANLSMRAKMLLLVGPPLVVLLALVSILSSSLETHRVLYDQSVLWQQHAARVLEVRAWTRDCVLDTYRFAQSGDADVRRHAAASCSHAHQVMQASAQLATRFGPDEVKEEAEVQEAFAGVMALVERVIQLRASGDTDTAQDLCREELLGEGSTALEEAIQTRVTEELEGAQAFQDQAALQASRATTLAVLLAVGLCLVVLLVAWRVLSLMHRQVSELAQGAQRFGRGDLRQPIAAVSGDELGALALSFNRMAHEVDSSRQQLAAQERLHHELSIAKRIQTVLLPPHPTVEGLDISACMLAAEDVGGDYYDVINTKDGAWLAIGDVAGHGLTAGLEMLMMQGAVSAVVNHAAGSSPQDVLTVVNRVLWDNIHLRLQRHDFATLTLLHYRQDGTLQLAGGHLPVVVFRAATRRCEALHTNGPWMASVDNVEGCYTEEKLTLGRGDLLLLHTDGLTEAANAQGEMFGHQRLFDLVETLSSLPVERVVQEIVSAARAWMTTQADDITLLVARKT